MLQILDIETVFLYIIVHEGDLEKEFIYKKWYIHSYMFELQSPSKHSPFDAMYLSRCYCHCSKQFSNSLILISLSASAIFCFTYSTLAKCFPEDLFFNLGNKKKVTCGEIRWIGKVEHGGHAVFGQKLLNTQHAVSRCTHKSPIMKWPSTFRVFRKIHWSQAQPLTTMEAGTLIQMGS